MPGYLVIDIETIKNPEVDWKPPEEGTQFPPIPVHQVVAVGGLSINMDGVPRPDHLCTFGRESDYTEYGVLTDLFCTIEETRLTLVTWNGRGFDIPVLISRAMRYGLQTSWAFDREFRYRYSLLGHLDLCDQMCDNGGAPRMRLDHVAQSIGLPGKLDGVDGTQVQQLADEGRYDIIREYVMLDVVETAMVLLRWLHVRGRINTAGYNGAVERTRELAAKAAGEAGLLRKALRQTRWDILMLPVTRPDGNGDDVPL